MDPDHGLEDEGPFYAWLPPEDRLWRHPSEAPSASTGVSSPASPKTHFNSHGVLGRQWTVALVASLIGAVTATGIGLVSGAFETHTTVIRAISQPSPVVSLASSPGSAINWTPIDDQIAPSVVAISVSGASGPVAGSGLLLMTAGGMAYVLTDRSLFTTGGEMGYLGDIEVTFLAGDRVRGHLVGQDPMTSLALIAVPEAAGDFPVLGSTAYLQVADPVLAVGARNAPAGSVLSGSVSADDLQVDLASGGDMDNLIAVGGVPVSGLAGGPLVDQYGRVVGITVGLNPIDSSDQGLTFAVPIDEAQIVARQLLEGGNITHPWLGVYNSADLASAVARQMNVTGGAQAGSVAPDSPASRLGITSSDVITALNGQPITSAGSLTAVLSHCIPGAMTTISFIHKGTPVASTVQVGNQPFDS